MQVRSITADAVNFTAAQTARGNKAPIQPENILFGPSCLVAISREGKNLSRQQAVQNGRDTEGEKDVRKQLRQLEKAEREKKAEEEQRAELHDAEEAEKAEKIAKVMSNPDEDDVLKAAMRESREMARGRALTGEELLELENEYEWLRKEMAAGHIQVSVEEFSDGIIDDRKHIHIRSAGSEDTCRIAEGSINHPTDPGNNWASSRMREELYEKFKAATKKMRDWMTKMHMVPSLLERYSETEMSERIESFFRNMFEEAYAGSSYLDSYTEEEWEEFNAKHPLGQISLSEQEKALEDFARRFASADSVNVTGIEAGDIVSMPAMPENGSLE